MFPSFATATSALLLCCTYGFVALLCFTLAWFLQGQLSTFCLVKKLFMVPNLESNWWSCQTTKAMPNTKPAHALPNFMISDSVKKAVANVHLLHIWVSVDWLQVSYNTLTRMVAICILIQILIFVVVIEFFLNFCSSQMLFPVFHAW